MLSLVQIRYDIQRKIIDLSLLPPCKEGLYLHILRSCYAAKIWRMSFTPQIELPQVENNGWTNNYEIKWIEFAFPEDITSILFYDTAEEDIFKENENSSDDKDDKDN